MRISDWSSDVCSSDLSSAGRLGVVLLAILAQLAVYYGFRRAAGGEVRRHAISIGMVVLANIVIFSIGAFFLIDLLRSLPEPLGASGVGALLLAVYAGLLWFCSRYPDLEMDDPSAHALSLPVPGPTLKSGLHFLIPVEIGRTHV